ncbi:MAG: type 1 glutamine amidotransferase [Planctomycetota bacterium]
MRFLLLQARNAGDPAGPHEAEAFRDELGLAPDQLTPYDLLQGRPPAGLVEDYDCVLVGGSGEFGVGDASEHPWLREFIDLMGDLGSRGFPTFASCFGFQALVVAGGGEVITDKTRAEVGTFELFTTEHGAADPLFRAVAPRFGAQLGHKDHATRLPSDTVHLAGSERSPYQALRVAGKPVYATQFHPELSMTRNRERFLRYLAAYSTPDMVDSPETVLARYRETTGATELLRAFVREVLLPLRRGP